MKGASICGLAGFALLALGFAGIEYGQSDAMQTAGLVVSLLGVGALWLMAWKLL